MKNKFTHKKNTCVNILLKLKIKILFFALFILNCNFIG